MSLDTEGHKWIKKLEKYDPEIADNMENMDADELKNRVLASQQNLLENERAKERDDALVKAKAKASQLEQPYKEAKEFQTAIVQYGLLILENRGKALTDE